MSKIRPTTGTDGQALPVLPPERDARVWARLVRVMFYTPGFLALLLIKAGEPTSFGITVELLMLSSAAAIVGGLYVGTESSGAGADNFKVHIPHAARWHSFHTAELGASESVRRAIGRSLCRRAFLARRILFRRVRRPEKPRASVAALSTCRVVRVV
jgi:hypothetical protein